MVISGYAYADLSIMKKSTLSKEKYNMYNLRRKLAPGSVMELSLVLKEINRFKKSLMLSGIKGVVPSGQDPTQLSFQLVKRN